jgi:acyl-CoA thioesterase-1
MFITFISCSSNKTASDSIEQIKLNITETSTIVCFGDSLTYGHGSDSRDETFPGYLQTMVNIPVINSGVNDDTTALGLARIQKDVLDHNPIIVLIDFGGNDLYNSKPKLTIKEIEANFRQMIQLIDNGNCKIYLIRYFNNQMRMFDVFFSFDRMLNRIKTDYPNIEVLENIWEGVWGKKELKYDFTHPNSKGYKIIAENIYNKIKPILEYNNLIK